MVRDFISELGGATALARDLSNRSKLLFSRERVAMWGTNNNVPYQWRAAVISIATERGVSVPDEIKQGVIVEAAQ